MDLKGRADIKSKPNDKEHVRKVIADVYLFIWDELEKVWTGEVGNTKRGIEFKTAGEYLLGMGLGIDDEGINIITDVRTEVDLPIKESNK